MNIREIFSLEDENSALADGFLNIRRKGGFRVYNYSKRAPFKVESWDNPAVLNSRGLIINDEDEVVARPWKKFFNYNEPQAGKLDYQAPVEVTDKYDGFLGVLFPNEREFSGVGISTRGSLDSEFAKHAQQLLNTTNSLWGGYMPGDLHLSGLVTPLVEIIYPQDTTVLNYGDLDNLVLLGGVVISTGEYLGPQETASVTGWKGMQTKVFSYKTLQEALEAPPRANAEGIVVRFLNENKMVKYKQEDYIQKHRLLIGLNELSVWEAIINGVPLYELVESLPDEFHQWTAETYTNICFSAQKESFRHLDALESIRDELPEGYTRKELVQKVLGRNDINHYVIFALVDNDVDRAMKVLLKELRPTGGGKRPTMEQSN
jgi:RNA ligase